jgi:hypothetical protein
MSHELMTTPIDKIAQEIWERLAPEWLRNTMAPAWIAEQMKDLIPRESLIALRKEQIDKDQKLFGIGDMDEFQFESDRIMDEFFMEFDELIDYENHKDNNNNEESDSDINGAELCGEDNTCKDPDQRGPIC